MSKAIALFQRLHWPVRRLITGEVRDRVIVLDYARIRDLSAVACEIRYYGGEIDIDGVKLDRCTFSFGGRAANALNFMKALQKCGADDVIRKTFGYTEEKTK